MQWAIGIWLFAFGACAGSFMNVVIWRLPQGRSVVYPGSRCPHCGHAVRSYDNIPILNWLILRGRCRDCGAGISWRYPAVETFVALLFVAVAIIEPLREGVNLPRFPDASPYYHWSGFISLWILYACQMLVLCTLFCAAFMWFDGNRPPRGLFIPASVVTLVVPLIWTELRPEPWLSTFAKYAPRASIGVESLWAVMIAILLASIFGLCFYPRGERQRMTAALGELLPVALLFGPAPFVRITLLATLLANFKAIWGRKQQRVQRLPWPACLLVATVVQILFWKESARWVEEFFGGQSWSVPAALLATVLLVATARLLAGNVPPREAGWNQDWPLQPGEPAHDKLPESATHES